MNWGRHASTAFVPCLLLGGLALVACPTPELKAPEKECQVDSYVFCRCEDRREGTKQCTDRGYSFTACDCGEAPLNPTGDAGFEPVDASVDPDKPKIDSACAGKLAVIASSDEEIEIYAAAYSGAGSWTVSKSTGTALRSNPRGGLINGALVTVWLTRMDKIAWTKFEAGQATLAAPFPVASALTKQPPTFATSSNQGTLFYLSTDDLIKKGIYSASTGWDDAGATLALVPDAGEVVGKGAPAVSVTASGNVIAYTDADKNIVVQSEAAGAWTEAAPIDGAIAMDTQAPAMTSLRGGDDDLLLVYRGTDQVLRSTSRSASGWSAPAIVDTTARAEDPASIAALANGRAIITWMASDQTPLYSIYDPTKTPRWSPPGTLFEANPTVRKSPTVGPGRCASEATATLIDAQGNVELGLLVDGKWTGPFPVPGMTNMTFAGSGEVP